jgi:hypothetical protein
MKTLFVALLTLATFTAKANNGNGEEPVAVKMEVKKVSTSKVQVVTNIVAKANETFEIQKSYDNKIFTTVALVLGTDETANMPALRISDVIKADATAYYRVVKTNGSNSVVLTSTVIVK